MPETNFQIIAYDSPKGAVTQNEIGRFTIMFNPSSFAVNNKIEYKQADAKGQSGGDPQFDKIPPLEFTVEFTVDGTGVTINDGMPRDTDSGISAKPDADYVRQKIRKLRDVTGSNINGEIHRPNYLALLWGTIHIECVITSLNVTYNMFARDGTPLRAKVNCGFLERIGPGKNGRQSRLESPDLTKYVSVKAGDLLSLIANTYYDDPAYYMQLAKANKLKNFRNLIPGAKLIIPPMKDNNG